MKAKARQKTQAQLILLYVRRKNNKHNVHTTLLNNGCWQRICEVAAVHAGGLCPFQYSS